MKNTFLVIIFSFLGGMFSTYLLKIENTSASPTNHKSYIQLFNSSGKQIGYFGLHEEGDQGTMFLFDKDGKPTVQLGSYPDGLEKGQSLLGLHDKLNYLRLLLRLHGANDSPVIVMKDNTGRDKMVIGLDGQTQKPYFKYMDNEGIMQNLIKD